MRARVVIAGLAVVALGLGGCKPAASNAVSGATAPSAAASAGPVEQNILLTVALSPAAREKIAATGQAITVPVTFYGVPTDPAERAELQGRLPVGPEQDVVIRSAESVTIHVPPLEPAKIAQVEHGQVLVAIDVSSGNHTSQNNLLNCDPYMDVPLAQAESQPATTINCKLIGEP